jgi:hypothetical protein
LASSFLSSVFGASALVDGAGVAGAAAAGADGAAEGALDGAVDGAVDGVLEVDGAGAGLGASLPQAASATVTAAASSSDLFMKISFLRLSEQGLATQTTGRGGILAAKRRQRYDSFDSVLQPDLALQP